MEHRPEAAKKTDELLVQKPASAPAESAAGNVN
jgi:hypothetical protein